MIFFDDHQVNHLDPLTCVRPAALLPCGVLSIAEKWERRLHRPTLTHFPRVLLRELYTAPSSDQMHLWINGRWIPDALATAQVAALAPNRALMHKDTLLAVMTDFASFKRWSEAPSAQQPWQFTECDQGWRLERAWELLDHTSREILSDLDLLSGFDHLSAPPEGVWITRPERVWVGRKVHIEPGVVMVPDDGLIVIDEGAHIQAGASLRGTCYIGKGSIVRMGTQLYGGVRMGRSCKVAGEVHESVLMDFVNKSHGGFLGHSILAEWVNIGADTNTSNLKNNYSTIKVDDWHTGARIDTGRQFLGSILADHTKIAIGSKLNSGTQAGLFSSFIHRDFSPKRIPHFAWYDDSAHEAEPATVYDFDKAITAARTAMSRRGQALEEQLLEVFRHYHPYSGQEQTRMDQ